MANTEKNCGSEIFMKIASKTILPTWRFFPFAFIFFPEKKLGAEHNTQSAEIIVFTIYPPLPSIVKWSARHII